MTSREAPWINLRTSIVIVIAVLPICSDMPLQYTYAQEHAPAAPDEQSKAKPYHGYFFKILKGQGPAAPLGKMDFVVEGAMIGGFAPAAAPAEYRVTGVQTFIVDYDGVVYQKDLGPDTLKLFQAMELYNPDKTWQPTNDGWQNDSSDASVSEAKN